MLYSTIGCQDLTIIKGQWTLIKGLGITLFPGAILCISGANGSGKTSLLKVMAGLGRPSGGKIIYDGSDITERIEEYHSLVSYFGHIDPVHEELTVLDNLRFWASINNAAEAITAAINYFELNCYINSAIHALSAGWRRKVSLSRLLLTHAPFWFLDEPFVHLDIKGAEQICNMMTVKASQGGIIVFASHECHHTLGSLSVLNINLADFR